jgi:ribosomal protein S18 acetylase RimI-like enzyme
MNVRRAVASDAAALHRLAAATFPLACPPHTTDEDKATFIAEHLSEDAFERYLADDDQEILVIGDFAGYTLTRFDAGGLAYLSKCYLRSAAQGTGAASELMTAAIVAAIERGATSMRLNVNEENARAHRFYEKHGFVRVGTHDFQVGSRLEHDYLYELVL